MGQSPETDDDSLMVRRSRQGDPAASRYLFDKYRERVFRLAYRYLGHREDALDATQQAFVNAFASLDRFAGQSSFYTWLARIAVNAAIDLRRRRLRSPEKAQQMELLESGRAPMPRFDPRPEQAAVHHELQQALRLAVDTLPEPQRQVFALHAYDGLSYREIAESLHCSIGTVMSRLFYARKRLQKILGPYL